MKLKKCSSLLLIFIFVFNLYFSIPVSAQDIELKAKSWVVIEPTTGKILLEKNAHEKLPPASITKIMTLLLIYEAIHQGKISLTDVVTVSDHASSMGGSQVYLEPGEQQTVADMLKCIAISSANDASVAMSEFIAGTEEAFVGMMNEKAKSIGMVDTHFVNACGLDVEDHYTSAYDIALMSRELTNNYPQIFKLTTTWQDTIIHKTKKGESEFGLTNTNKLIKWYPGANGLKTGSTGKALYCLSGTAERNGLKLVGVIMAAPDHKARFQEMMKLFDYGFANYKVVKGKRVGEKVGEVKVAKGRLDRVDAIVNSEVGLLLKKGESEAIQSKLELLPSIVAPFEKGTKLGEVTYFSNGTKIGSSDIVAKEDVGKSTFSYTFNKLIHIWLR